MSKEEYESKLKTLATYKKFLQGIELGLRNGMRLISAGVAKEVQPVRDFVNNLERELGIKAEEPKGFVTREKMRRQRLLDIGLEGELDKNAMRTEIARRERELEAQKKEKELKTQAQFSTGVTDYIMGLVSSGYKKVKKLVPIFASLAIVFAAFYALRNNFSITGYTVINSVTGNASYLLILVLIIIIIGFYRLNKE